MNIININNLEKYFTVKKGPFFRRRKEIKKAVNGVSFSIKQGEIFSLLGPNGAGKTTTIKMLATLLIPTSGTATIKGYNIVKDVCRPAKTLCFIYNIHDRYRCFR